MTTQHTPGPIETTTARLAVYALSPLALAGMILAVLAALIMGAGYTIRLTLAAAAGLTLPPLPTAAGTVLSAIAAALLLPAIATQLHALHKPSTPALRIHHAATLAALTTLTTALLIPHAHGIAWAALLTLLLAAALPLATAPGTHPQHAGTAFTPLSLTATALLSLAALLLTPEHAPLLITATAAAHLITQAEWTPTTHQAPASARRLSALRSGHARHLAMAPRDVMHSR